ncbi:MAG TPA: hypothetical protein VG673_10345 [Actinomycetota bacterium]|nr:hypothetical protein [Actinomycetota bacterium]
MTARSAARLAWSLCAASVAGIGGLLVLKVLNGPADLRSAPLVTAPLAFSVVGALVAARQHRNPVGWQLLAVGVLLTTNLLGESYARYALVTAPGSLPGGLYGPWLGWTYAPIVAILAIFLPLYFPTGRLLSPRWRPVLWSGIGFLVFAVAGNALMPGPQPPLLGLAPVPNPVVYLPEAKPLFQLFRNLAAVCAFPGIAGAIAALVVRFRRSRGIERQQLKWFTYAAALAPLPALVYELAPSLFGLLQTLVFPLVPISVGIAILRYRLYEIDRIINRSLVYGLLTVVLGLCYAAGSLVFVLVAGTGADPPSWLVAGATLAAAAIFRPARRRIQAAVNRRFNRRRYNAAQTIQAFSTRLRDQIDLDTLASELLAVIDQTMEPTRSSLWLRPPPPGSPGTAPRAPRPTPWAY